MKNIDQIKRKIEQMVKPIDYGIVTSGFAKNAEVGRILYDMANIIQDLQAEVASLKEEQEKK